MVGKGRHPILGLTSSDPVLGIVGSVGLAASAGTALVIDLGGGERSSGRTLRDIIADGPSLAEMSPGRRGVALIRGGDVDPATAYDIASELSRRWPAVVMRLTPESPGPFPTVTAAPLYPGRLLPAPAVSHCVWQPLGLGADPPAPGLVLPRLRPATLRKLLGGHVPRRSRWIAAWSPVWEMPWA